MSHAATKVPSLEELRAELSRALFLTREQQERLEPILRRRQQQLLDLEHFPEDQRPAAVAQINDAIRGRVRAILTPEQQALYDEHAGRWSTRSGRPGVVWTLGPDGRPRATWLQLGITDGAFTEVVGGDLKEGQQVVVAAVSRSGAAGVFSPIAALRFR